MIKSVSFWEKSYYEDPRDVIIVGAGFVGLSAGIEYKQQCPSKSVSILERGAINYGASTRNAGFACFGSIGELNDDLLNAELAEIISTVEMRYRGLENLLSIVEAGKIEYLNYGSIELFESEDQFVKASETIDFWNKKLVHLTGHDIFEVVDNLEQEGYYYKAIRNRFESQLNPKLAIVELEKMARTLGVEILYGLEVANFTSTGDHVEIDTKEGLKFSCSDLLLATNAFTNRIHEVEDLKAARNQVLITESIPNLAWKGCYHLDKGYVYFRNVGDRILLGGARNISQNEDTDEYGNTIEMKQHLTKILEEKIMRGAAVKVAHWWSGILGVGSQKHILLKNIAPRVFIGVRLGGMGVAIGTLIGKELANMIIADEV